MGPIRRSWEVLGGVGLILPAMTGVTPKLTPLAAVGVVAFIAVGRWNLRPIAPAAITTARALKSVAVLGLLVLLVFAPPWRTSNHLA